MEAATANAMYFTDLTTRSLKKKGAGGGQPCVLCHLALPCHRKEGMYGCMINSKIILMLKPPKGIACSTLGIWV